MNNKKMSEWTVVNKMDGEGKSVGTDGPKKKKGKGGEGKTGEGKEEREVGKGGGRRRRRYMRRRRHL